MGDTSFLYLEVLMRIPEKKSDQSLKKNKIQLLSPAMVYLVLASILGIFTTSFLLLLLNLVLEIFNQ